MATPQLSPGVLIREVDLTVGRADNVLDNIGAIAGPFAIGPVDEAIDIPTENELINVFGKPQNLDGQYEYWMSASSFLSYGGVLKVVRTDGVDLANANARRLRTGEVSQLTILSGNSDSFSVDRPEGTYTINNGKYSSSGIGTDLVLSVGIGTTGNTTAVSIIAGGSVFLENDTITIPNSQLGAPNLGPVSELTVTSGGSGGLSTYRQAGTYTITGGQYTTSGIGTNLELSVGINTLGAPTTITIDSAGLDFAPSNTVTISNSQLGATGIGTAGTLVLSVSDIENGNLVLNVSDIYTTGGISTVGQPGLKIKNFDDYQANFADDIASYIFAAKNPGTWSNSLKVCFIDDKADQIISVGSTIASQCRVGYAVTVPLNNVVLPGTAGTVSFSGHLKGIITGVQEDAIDVKIVSRVAIGTDADTLTTYKQRNQASSIRPGNRLFISDESTSIGVHTVSLSERSVLDWYDQQTLGLNNGRIFWKSIAPKPISNGYVLDRNGRNDALHVVVIDDNGTVTGIQANLLEKHLNLSKATDAVSAVNSPQKIFWKSYIAQYSKYLYVGDNPSDESNNEEIYQTGFVANTKSPLTIADGLWNEPAQDKVFSALGNATYELQGGVDYIEGGGTGSFTATLGDIMTSYDLFNNRDEIQVDYLLMGPGLQNKEESQQKASHLISIANGRKDCVAVISPHRTDVVDVLNTTTQTNNIIEFFSPLGSTSYAVFDSGYKYTYDRFNNRFRYIPCNADVAGLCVRTSIFAYPWFSPAGQQRGILNNAIKLAYNPTKAQRDLLYPQRINAIINQPGIGILLFGDKTALGYASAFDRINVRRLFLTVEQALERTAQAQLFELNDEITRANFVNIVEPYLRDVQAKRGLYGFLVKCDETNNTPDVIDNNEFRADIFLKPAKSINYVTLTFVATRTGVSFEEVVGTV
jgi:hypothetical protein